MTPFIASHIAASIPENPTPEERTHAGNTASLIGIVLNILLALGKGTVGFIAGSVSIVADSVNNLSDAASSIVSLIGFKLASRPADEGHPYGMVASSTLRALSSLSWSAPSASSSSIPR